MVPYKYIYRKKALALRLGQDYKVIFTGVRLCTRALRLAVHLENVGSFLLYLLLYMSNVYGMYQNNLNFLQEVANLFWQQGGLDFGDHSQALKLPWSKACI